VWFARKLHCSRTNVYNIFQKTNLDVELLKRISVILNYNFFEEICAETHAKILENQRESLGDDSQSLTAADQPSASKRCQRRSHRTGQTLWILHCIRRLTARRLKNSWLMLEEI